MQEHTTTTSHELDKPANGLLWIAVIYPLFVTVLSITCQSKMSSIIQSIPITERASSVVRQDQTPAGGKAAPLVDKDGNSDIPPKEDGDVVEPAPLFEATQTPPKASNPNERHSVSNPEASLQSHPINEAEGRVSSIGVHKSQFVQASILHTLVVLMTHRLGILATRSVQEAQHSGEKIIALIAMFVVTFLALLSGGKVELGRALSAQGYRHANGGRPPVDRSDPFAVFIVLCFYSYLIPWVRLLIALFWTGS
ncbi:hypothetical protein PV04_09672 [Phialophora macrospora]|uniref:Uncharacterized protein n=1 Tax=Phialophora macrospora TaxID=1851006 RepID=A0A0D2DRC9_9EURO|nr:hypothetical protein PV04_09672 [Phialophora macrospora]